MYADDVVIYVCGESVHAVSNELSQHLEAVAAWFENAGLSLNVKKTLSVCFSSRAKTPTEELNLEINGQKIKQVPQIKYLGLVLDSHLNFESHIKKVCGVAKANLYTFKVIRDCLPFHAAQIFMHSMIFSHINYCITSWSQANVTATMPLKRIYNRAAKILAKKPIRSHHCVSLVQLKMLNFENFIKNAQLKLVHKCLYQQAPQVLCDSIVPLRSVGSRTRAAYNRNCKVPIRETAFGRTAFTVQGTNNWNNLPTGLKLETDWVRFKYKLKQFLVGGQTCDH